MRLAENLMPRSVIKTYFVYGQFVKTSRCLEDGRFVKN
jgi:hypothetical protein